MYFRWHENDDGDLKKNKEWSETDNDQWSTGKTGIVCEQKKFTEYVKEDGGLYLYTVDFGRIYV